MDMNMHLIVRTGGHFIYGMMKEKVRRLVNVPIFAHIGISSIDCIDINSITGKCRIYNIKIPREKPPVLAGRRCNRWDNITAYPAILQKIKRHLVECFFQRLKWFRRIATRYDKLDASFFAFVLLASIAIVFI